MKIYTRTGDEGETGLFGGGRVSKSDLRVEAYGSVDELNSVIGWAITQQTDAATEIQLITIQSDLFVIGAHLATPSVTRGKRPQLPELPEARVADLEQAIDAMETTLPPLQSFIIPGGSAAGAALHHARTVCRRAERRTIALNAKEPLNTFIVVYLNRLSDFLFVAARYTNHLAGVSERPWP